MNENELILIVVSNKRSLSKLGDVQVYLTQTIKRQLESEKTKNGETLFSLFERGMALRGFKHLIEKIREKDKEKKIVFTHTKTEQTENEIKINYDDYRKSAGEKFFTFYREIGLDSAGYYLGLHFPDVFTYEGKRITEADHKTIDKNFSEVLQRANKKKKNKKAIIDQTSKIISDLTEQKRVLKKEVTDLEELRNKSNIFFFTNKIEELKQRLTKTYSETTGKNSWQRWVYENNWMFGVNYQPPIEKQKINIAGSMPDYMFPTLDGFLDILEIKLPSKEIIVKDSHHNNSYAWSSDANKAIGQVVTYLSEIELYQLHLKEEIKRVYGIDIYLIKPRAFILIGSKAGWTQEQHKALRKLNYSLHGIEVITYSDLMERGKVIVNNYTKTMTQQ